jgi:intein/homing endonuclease
VRHVRLLEWFEALAPGVKPRARVEVWPRGGAKCILHNMEILCADGTRKAIRDIAVGQEILSFNETTGRFEVDVISQKWDSGIKPCLQVKTRTGKSVTLTPEHRVLTFDGWKLAGDLTIGDRIASPRNTAIAPTIVCEDEEVRLLAYLLAEGTTAQKSCLFTNSDEIIVADFIKCAHAMGFWVKATGKYGWRLSGEQSGNRSKGAEVSSVRRWLSLHGMTQCGALTKRIPDFVYKLPERQKWMFLAAFVDTDGWIQADKARIGITLANRALIEDLAYLWAQVGVVTAMYEKPNKHAGAWALHVDQDCLLRCSENLPLILKGEKLRTALQTPRYSLLDTYPKEVCRNLPEGVNRKLRNSKVTRLGTPYDVTRNKIRRALEVEEIPQWRFLEQAEVFWDKVTSVEDAGLGETYDVEVNKNHNLITNLLVSHNSSTGALGVVRLGAREVEWQTERADEDGGVRRVVEVRPPRRFVLYVSGTQGQANKHVAGIATKFEQLGVPPLVGAYGNSKGWKVDLLRTSNGFNVLALGLDAAARGLKLDDFRPDLIIFDDIDSRHDSPDVVEKKISTITDSILPAGSTDCAVLFLQNKIHKNSVVSQLCDGRAKFLLTREPAEVEPAVYDLELEIEEDADGEPFFRIIGGRASWEGQDLATCEGQINDWGKSAFLREANHKTDEAEDGLWQGEWIEANRITRSKLPDLERVVVGIDPSGGAGQWGIVAKGRAGSGERAHYYTLEDATPKVGTSTGTSADEAIACYVRNEADAFAVETNFGGDMAETILRRAAKDAGVAIRIVTVVASRGKQVRAEPVAELAEKGYEHHVGFWPELEGEKKSWKPGDKSPNRLDADVWATYELMPGEPVKKAARKSGSSGVSTLR